MMVGVARLVVARQGAVGEDRMLGVCSTSPYLGAPWRAGYTARRDSMSAWPMGARSSVPVMSSHGIFTAPDA
jgi:hypothetical protein